MVNLAREDGSLLAAAPRCSPMSSAPVSVSTSTALTVSLWPSGHSRRTGTPLVS